MLWRPVVLALATVVTHVVAASTPCLPARPLSTAPPVAAHAHVHAHAPEAARPGPAHPGAGPGHVHESQAEPVAAGAPVLGAPCPCGCDRAAAPPTGAGRLGPAIPPSFEAPRWPGRPLAAAPPAFVPTLRAPEPAEPIPIAV